MPISRNPGFADRLLSALSYLSTGFIGAVWLIIAAIFRKQVSGFAMYHIFQSIFLSIAYFLLTTIGGLIVVIIARIPLINQIPILLNSPIGFAFNLSIIQLCTTLLLIYLTLTSFLGLYSYIPWVSEIIKGNTPR